MGDVIHESRYPFNPTPNASVCGNATAPGRFTMRLGGPPALTCSDCIRVLAEEDAAYRARMREAEKRDEARESIAQALFGWIAA